MVRKYFCFCFDELTTTCIRNLLLFITKRVYLFCQLIVKPIRLIEKLKLNVLAQNELLDIIRNCQIQSSMK